MCYSVRAVGQCSRELDYLTTSNVKPGAECSSTDPFGHKNNDIGNPDGRIPEHIPARLSDGETIAETGNPDIRVPDNVKRDNGLHARRALTTRDAEEGDAEGGERKETVLEQTPTEEQMNIGQEDTAAGQDGPEELERRHVPGGTCLSQDPHLIAIVAIWGSSDIFMSLIATSTASVWANNEVFSLPFWPSSPGLPHPPSLVLGKLISDDSGIHPSAMMLSLGAFTPEEKVGRAA
ncbi:hypothetical protein NDU88_002289 [Pleurodeles waltl]|uniref:Uncharacterized protein n=1 Tax=Pleurodeles waltl TaxID=8319 RepID=A0AAV7WP20_PLEWA|nr:hypothetical protein NDU88_002289 [Pleurodeles waltl]